MKYYCLILYAIILGCQNQDNGDLSIAINKNDLPHIKSLIIEGYNRYDSVFYTSSVNHEFRNYILNEFGNSDLYYDNIVYGFSIKHYSLPHYNMEFVLIRGTDGDYYYSGFTDKFYYENELLKLGYKKEGNCIICDNCKIDTISMQNSGESELLSKILKEDPFFLIEPENRENENSYSPKIDKMIVLVHYIYQTYNWSQFHTLQPLFKEVLDLESKLKQLQENDTTNKAKDLAAKYEKLIYYYPDKRIAFFEQPYAGLFLFYIEYSKGKFEITKEFLPASKIFIR
jgi:hypothetical protein